MFAGIVRCRLGVLPALLLALLPTGLTAQVSGFALAVAEAASDDPDLSAYYRRAAYQPLWVGADEDDRTRRAALLEAIDNAPLHGLPATRYDGETLRGMLAAVRTERDRGLAEVALSRLFLAYARDVETGILTPMEVVPAIKRDVARRDRLGILTTYARSRPHMFIAGLTPRAPEYTRLAREKLRLEEVITRGGWGAPISASRIESGDRGPAVIALRDRLEAMGYLDRNATMVFDEEIRNAVLAFQVDHGLEPDGIVGGDTLSELNLGARHRLGQILVAMERERWLDRDPGARHVWVNLTDFAARIVENGEVRFQTRSVIGKNEAGRETPEFSDVMEHMVINPTWYIPRSIVVKEYLPVLRRNPYALGHLLIVDGNGRTVSRNRGFGQYDARTFPYSMRQEPSDRNALGLVKFMFPNKDNIYLHDTPAKNLFSQPVRAYSHGCIRLNDPFDFAYALLTPQSDDPEELFQRHLQSGRETRVDLEEHVPVHLVYRTAIAKPGGGMEYRRDVYGRDALILAALRRAGVALPGSES